MKYWINNVPPFNLPQLSPLSPFILFSMLTLFSFLNSVAHVCYMGCAIACLYFCILGDIFYLYFWLFSILISFWGITPPSGVLISVQKLALQGEKKYFLNNIFNNTMLSCYKILLWILFLDFTFHYKFYSYKEHVNNL